MALKPLNWTGKETARGVSKKPDACRLCPNYVLGNGFVQDETPADAKIAILLPSPTKNDIVACTPLSEGMGRWWDFNVSREMGVPRSTFLFAHVLRCQCWYPTGDTQRKVEAHCRVHDAAIEAFDPNLFYLNFEPKDVIETPAFRRLFLKTVEKAIGRAAEGFRPLVACGREPVAYMAPYTNGTGGTKSWVGHWWEGKWGG